MNTNHTLGPWRIGDKYQTDIYAARAGHAIARTVNPQHEGECEANARLIASAPDLLEALQAVLHDCDDLDMVESNEPGRDAGPWLMATNAIAKATGNAA